MKKLLAIVAAIGVLPVANAQADWGEARWIWPSELGAPTNTTVEFSCPFVAAQAGAAKLAIAADTVYRVELNGRCVAETGRFPDVPPERFYDVLPVGGILAGTNELRVSVYVQGVVSFQHLPGKPGTLFSLVGDGCSAASGPGVRWRLSTRDRAEGVPLVTGQLGYSFIHDATAAEAPWRPVSSADLGPSAAAIPLRERPVPRTEILPAVRTAVIGQGALDGSPAPADLAAGMDATAMRPVPADAFFAADGRTVDPRFFRDGFYVLVDLGREETGLLDLEVDTDAGAVIDIGHAEHIEDGRLHAKIWVRNFAGRYVARGGRQTFCRWARRMAGRYIQLHVRGVSSRFVLHRLSVRPALVPLEELPLPAGLTSREQDVYRTSVRTLRLCLHEHYEDCPWREQALYANDARNQMLAGYCAFDASNRFPELAIELLAKGRGADDWLELCMPSRIEITIPSFTFCWVMSVADNLRFRNDVGFVRRMMPTVRSVLDRRCGEVKDGLLPCPPGKRYWQFYEWVDGLNGAVYLKDGETRFESPLNLFFVLALESGATCAAACGDAGTAARWRGTASRVRAAVRDRFWDGARGEIRTELGKDGPAAELVQALALLADAVPPAKRGDVARRLSAPSDWTATSLSQSLYKYEALVARGGDTARQAVRSMTATWASMLERGATSFWEVAQGWKAFGNAGSLCHGWSAIPAYVYRTYPALCAGAARTPEARQMMMAWAPADGPFDKSAGQEVTDYVSGVTSASIAAAEASGADGVRHAINDIALAAGARCWVAVKGADAVLADAALARYLASGVVFDFSDGAAEPTDGFLVRARTVTATAEKRRGFAVRLGVRLGPSVSDEALARLKPSLGERDLVIAPMPVLARLSDAAGRFRLVADDQPTRAADYLPWFERGLAAGFSGFCFTSAADVPSDKVPFLTLRRLTEEALAEYRTVNVIPAPRRMTLKEGTVEATTVTYADDASLPAEGYRLSVGPKGVSVASADADGRFYAEATLRQLRRPDGSYPCVEIEDAPEFRWRGVQIDESRHFFGKDVVKKLLDTMADYKFNVLHWHLTDSEGWRLDVPGLPDLVKYGAVRPSSDRFGAQRSFVDGKFRVTQPGDGATYGPFYYTEADVREILAHAAARHITVIPEIDFPSHFAAALAAYPQFACDPSAAAARTPNCSTLGGADSEDIGQMVRKGNARNVMCVGNDEAIAFLERVLDYVCRLFPSDCINIGGDECPTSCWEGCAKCRARIRAEGLSDVKGLQPWLTRRFVAFLEARGKRVMGYDEMLADGAPTDITGWYWRPERWIGRKGQREVRTMADWTSRGYDMVNCDWDYTYFYCNQNLDEDPFMYGGNVEIGQRPFGGDSISLEKVHSFDPARGVAERDRRHVLGSVCSNWAEYTWNRYDFEWKLWPRALALAEVLWSGRGRPDFADFRRRAAVARRRLIRAGVNCAPLAD